MSQRRSRLAQAAAEVGAGHGHYVPAASVADRIRWAVGLVDGLDDEDALEVIDRLVGTGVATQEAVPAAFAIASLAPDDPWRACRLAARLGGDSDTVAAMAGAVVGACCGLSAFPSDAVQLVRDGERPAPRAGRRRAARSAVGGVSWLTVRFAGWCSSAA